MLLATGISDIEPAIEGFESAKEQGLIRYCPICDGFEFKNRRIGIIGTGEHGVKEARFTKNYSSDLSLLDLSPSTSIDRSLEYWLQASQVRPIRGVARKIHTSTGRGACVSLEMMDGSMHPFDVLYCALGNKVRSQLAIELGADHDSQNGLVVDGHLQTSVAGLYAAGDVVSSLDQIAVATGQAAIASTAIHNAL